MLGIEIFAVLDMDMAQETPGLFAFQDHVADLDPARQMLGRHAFLKQFSRVVTDNRVTLVPISRQR